LMLKIIELDPLEKWIYQHLGFTYWINGEFVKAEESMNHFLLFYPNSGAAHGVMGQIQLSLGHPEKALEYIEKQTHPFWILYHKSMAVYAAGEKEEANTLLDQLIADWGAVAWPNVAYVYAFRGEKNEAFKWLELAFENKDSSLLEILNFPHMENL